MRNRKNLIFTLDLLDICAKITPTQLDNQFIRIIRDHYADDKKKVADEITNALQVARTLTHLPESVSKNKLVSKINNNETIFKGINVDLKNKEVGINILGFDLGIKI